ncbi:hypothetical protein [Actinacidiphila sp. ITFR-21]|uniref:hypothetical protein n=1 Tax=Actinacidiphila sp. ITFR-21 TaxID=3075199 RepID=UPI002889C6FE|nr:hypothetical protein [Streptomyces sp. ITFR-21]WNI18055.1 hypothetical protein RLT57_22560 [Streptomyces sp. ITFR-21]
MEISEHVPGLNSYIRRLRVGPAAVFADILGTDLVSVLRGDAGTWPQVRDQLDTYVHARGTLVEREASQPDERHPAGPT